MHEFPSGLSWFNTDNPIKISDLYDTVVLIDFWTYSCINCIRTLPFLKQWYEKYHKYGFEIIGIHAPEFGFEKDALNVKNAIKQYDIPYPVVLDNDYKLWTVYNNNYWPAHYLFDSTGKIRYTHFGEGEYKKTENMIIELLKENGKDIKEEMYTPEKTPVNFGKIGSPETYLGYKRMVGFASQEQLIEDKPQYYTIPDEIKKNRVYFQGLWKIEAEKSVLAEPIGQIVYRYSANKINLVMGAKSSVKAQILIDGEKLQIGNKGDHISDQGFITVKDYNLYNLINTRNYYEIHTCTVIFYDGEVEVYAFTFG